MEEWERACTPYLTAVACHCHVLRARAEWLGSSEPFPAPGHLAHSDDTLSRLETPGLQLALRDSPVTK